MGLNVNDSTLTQLIIAAAHGLVFEQVNNLTKMVNGLLLCSPSLVLGLPKAL